MHFLEFLIFLRKTLTAHISAPRRGTEAIQYSKSSSGSPLCSQTSPSTWGSIKRALEAHTLAWFKILKLSKISPFGPKNHFLNAKSEKWIQYTNVIYYPSKISHQGVKRVKKWPIYRYFSVLSQNSGNFGQNEEGVKNGHFPHSLRFCHNWSPSVHHMQRNWVHHMQRNWVQTHNK